MSCANLKKSRVLLLVEDPAIYEATQKALISVAPECDLWVARDHEIALEFLLSWTFDLAVLDLAISQGRNFLGILGSRTPPVPAVIFTTYLPSIGPLEDLVKAGQWVYLPRGDVESIGPTCERLLSCHRSLRPWRLRAWMRSTVDYVSGLKLYTPATH